MNHINGYTKFRESAIKCNLRWEEIKQLNVLVCGVINCDYYLLILNVPLRFEFSKT